MDIRNTTLILKTSDFTANSDYVPGSAYSHYKGSCNSKLSSITWNNINLRTLLGDMYSKYNSFNLCLNSITTSSTGSVDITADSKNVLIRMTGLPWLNQTYNTKIGNNTNIANIGLFSFNLLASTSTQYNNNSTTFSKNQDMCNITIDYSRVVDDTVVNSNLYGSLNIGYKGTALINTNVITLDFELASFIIVGSLISTTANGIPAGTYIKSISLNGLSVTISQNTIAALNLTVLNIQALLSYPNVNFMFNIIGIPDDGPLPERIPIK